MWSTQVSSLRRTGSWWPAESSTNSNAPCDGHTESTWPLIAADRLKDIAGWTDRPQWSQRRQTSGAHAWIGRQRRSRTFVRRRRRIVGRRDQLLDGDDVHRRTDEAYLAELGPD